jgi:hypothetical protein
MNRAVDPVRWIGVCRESVFSAGGSAVGSGFRIGRPALRARRRGKAGNDYRQHQNASRISYSSRRSVSRAARPLILLVAISICVVVCDRRRGSLVHLSTMLSHKHGVGIFRIECVCLRRSKPRLANLVSSLFEPLCTKGRQKSVFLDAFPVLAACASASCCRRR